MGYVVVVVVIAVVSIAFAVLRVRAKLDGEFRAGDFFKTSIPRTLERPLAMGTRLDIAAALKKRGMAREEIKQLLDRNNDQELLDRYWAQPGA